MTVREKQGRIVEKLEYKMLVRDGVSKTLRGCAQLFIARTSLKVYSDTSQHFFMPQAHTKFAN